MSAAAFLAAAHNYDVAVSIEGDKLCLLPLAGSVVPSDLLVQARLLKHTIISELSRSKLDFVPIGRECPMSDPADDWRPGQAVSIAGAPHLRSASLWCAHCGRFPDQTQEGEVYAVGVSFYCAECCKF
jgi:hypothetical protein